VLVFIYYIYYYLLLILLFILAKVCTLWVLSGIYLFICWYLLQHIYYYLLHNCCVIYYVHVLLFSSSMDLMHELKICIAVLIHKRLLI